MTDCVSVVPVRSSPVRSTSPRGGRMKVVHSSHSRYANKLATNNISAAVLLTAPAAAHGMLLLLLLRRLRRRPSFQLYCTSERSSPVFSPCSTSCRREFPSPLAPSSVFRPSHLASRPGRGRCYRSAAPLRPPAHPPQPPPAPSIINDVAAVRRHRTLPRIRVRASRAGWTAAEGE